jgi:hypothetical protein
MARHPKRTVTVVKLGRAAPDVARKARAAKDDPRVRDSLDETRDALTSAGSRLRSNDLAGAVTDEKLWAELRRAAAAMAAGYAAAQSPKPKPKRRRLRKLVLTVGVIGAGAYAGYRATRGVGGDDAPPGV